MSGTPDRSEAYGRRIGHLRPVAVLHLTAHLLVATGAAALSALRLAGRLVTIIGIVAIRATPALPTMLTLRVVRGRDAATRYRYRWAVDLIQALGPTFVKFAQIGSTRRDAMPAALCDELSVLHDAVIPMSSRARARALRRAFGGRLEEEFAEVEERPLASGSIACVYRATLLDGRRVALKVRRPNIERRMAADLALVRGLVRVGERLPKMRGMPMADLVEYISIAVLGQLDFDREARNLERLRAALAPVPDVRVPQLIPGRSTPECLVLEYLPRLHRDTPELLVPEVRARLASTVLAAAHRMLFVEGFVHCDLHPGNVYLTPEGEVVVLDAGYSVQLPEKVRDLIAEFFAGMAAGDGRRCGELVLASAVRVDPDTDVDGFIGAVADLVARAAGPDNDFDMPVFGQAMFDLQRDHGLYAASDFAFPLMSLMVLEGTVRGFWPDVDFQQVGVGHHNGGQRTLSAVYRGSSVQTAVT
ncbi:MAG TPA: AarF/UbiB family protein [Nitriliruptorales bacterium]|nr:AarF/UbiB family protein [Nitriliruptorales bacterium]